MIGLVAWLNELAHDAMDTLVYLSVAYIRVVPEELEGVFSMYDDRGRLFYARIM